MLEEMEPWRELVEAVSNGIVGETRSFLNGSCKKSECNMANLITDAMVDWVNHMSFFFYFSKCVQLKFKTYSITYFSIAIKRKIQSTGHTRRSLA